MDKSKSKISSLDSETTKLEASQSAQQEKRFSGITRTLPLISQVELALRAAVRDRQFPGGEIPTLKELSGKFGVSRETVRLALQSLLKEGLLVKGERNKVFINLPAQSEMSGSQAHYVLGYLQEEYEIDGEHSETVSLPHSKAMLEGALSEAEQHQCQLVAHSAKPFHLREAYDNMKAEAGKMDGVIFASVSDEKYLRKLSGRGLPVVLIDHDMNLPKIGSIRSDSEQNAVLAVEHLLELGHQRIVCATWRQSDLNPWFTWGYRRAMRAGGLNLRRAWEIEVELNAKGAAETLRKIFSPSPRPTAIICFHNTFASQVIAEALQQGLKIPDDLSVVGCGGEQVTDLTCTRADWKQFGSQAVQMILKAITEGRQHEPEHLLVSYQLHKSGSTAAAHEA